MSQFPELMNSLANLKNKASDLAKIYDENDGKAAGLVDNSVSLIECASDSCTNPSREVQRPITKIYTEALDEVEGDKLWNKVAKNFNGYKKSFEESSLAVADLVNKCRQSYGGLRSPVVDLMRETGNSYTKFKVAINILVKPLNYMIQGVDITEFRAKKLKDAEVLKKFESLLIDLEKNFTLYNNTSKKFNEETYNVFVNIETVILKFSEYIEDKFLEYIRKIPGILGKGIILLPEVAQELLKGPKKDEKGRAEYFDEKLYKLLEVMKDAELKREKAEFVLDVEMNNIKVKLSDLTTEIQNYKNKYMKYVNELKSTGEKICEIIDEIRKLFDKDKLKLSNPGGNIEYPFLEFVKKLNVVYDKLEDIKKEIKPKLKLVMIALGNHLNKITIDLSFIMDITISMDDLLDEIRKSIKYIVDKIKHDSPGTDIRFGYMGYRDFADLEQGDTYVKINFTTDVDYYKSELDKIVARGGGDDAEDVCGGLNDTLNMNWKSNARYCVYIADAPAHGMKYHTGDVVDNYPQGDPNGLILEDLMREFSRKKINFNAIRIGEFNDIQYKIMEKSFNEEVRSDKDCFFGLFNYDNTDEKSGKKVSLRHNIAKTAIDIFNRFKEREIKIN